MRKPWLVALMVGSVVAASNLALAAPAAQSQDGKLQGQRGDETVNAHTVDPTSALQPGTLSYKMKVQMGERAVDAKVHCEVKADGDTWVVTETSESPMGTATDSVVVTRDTLALRKRSAIHGPVNIDYDVKGGKIVGELKMNGSAQPIDVPLEGELFADLPGAHRLLATLPIAEGYTTTFRNFDVRQRKVNATEVKVVGTEAVTVPAGTFDSYTVELTTPDNGSKATVWVAKESRKVVKSVAVSPQMGGATITTELE